MKCFYLLACMEALFLVGCFKSSETVSYPIENLFSLANVDEFGYAFGDSALRATQQLNWKKVLDSTNQKVEAYWDNMDRPVAWVRLWADSRKFPRSTRDDVPARWRTRDGVYVWITIDSLQAINGKPFYLDYDGTYFTVINWEEGKLAKSGIDMYMQLEGDGQPEGFMSSQQIIDSKMNVRGQSMVVWNSGWPKENLAATNGIPGDYPMASARALMKSDITLLNYTGLRLMRNEILARHGYMFIDEDLYAHFQSKRWYKRQFEDVQHLLTDIEKKNINLINEREAELYYNRPITNLMKELPLLSLPLDLELSIAESVNIPHDIEDPDGNKLLDAPTNVEAVQELMGILPDTSRYFAVLWRAVDGWGEENEGIVRSTHVTTFDKRWRRIEGAAITVSHDPARYSSSGCSASEFFESTLNEDLSFLSKCRAYMNCPNEGFGEGDAPHHLDIAEGQINDDGTLRVNYDGGY